MHYMNLYGGGASIEELEQLNGVETALRLITENEGILWRMVRSIPFVFIP